MTATGTAASNRYQKAAKLVVLYIRCLKLMLDCAYLCCLCRFIVTDPPRTAAETDPSNPHPTMFCGPVKVIS